MDSTVFGSFSLLTIWCFIGHGASQYQDLHCEALGSRQAREMTKPGPECDLSLRGWCTQKTTNYPEDKIMELILDNRGVMKRLFGDSREVRMIQDEVENSIQKPERFPSQPPPRRTVKNRKATQKEGDDTPPDVANFKTSFESPIANKVPSHRHEIGPDISTTEMSEIPTTTERTTLPQVVKASETNRQKPNSNKVRFPGSADRSEPPQIKPTTPIPIDLNDDLRYTQIKISSHDANSSKEEPSVKQPTIKEQSSKSPHSTQYLKGRVEPTRSAPNENTPSYVENNREKPKQPVYTRPTKDKQPQLYNLNQSGASQSLHTQQSSSMHLQRPPQRPPQPQLEAPYMMEKFAACNSTTELIAPTWAKNMQGKDLIVVNVGSFMQHLQIEECDKNSINRKMYCQRGCRCEQQYRYQKLLVMDPDDECRGIFSDWFRFPSCCTCVCYPRAWQRTTLRGGRIFNDEEYAEFYDEDQEFFEFDDQLEDDPTEYVALPSENHIDVQQPLASTIDRMYVAESKPIQMERKKTPNGLSTEFNFGRPLKIASLSKKSRLLNESPRIVNIQPQKAPRRRPPPMAPASSSPYQGPWSMQPNKLPWAPPRPSYYYKPLQQWYGPPLFRSWPIQSVTPFPPIESATLGTLNAATPPFHSSKWRENVARSLDGSGKENREPLRRIPRSLGAAN